MPVLLLILLLPLLQLDPYETDWDGLLLRAVTEHVERSFPETASRMEVRMLQIHAEVENGDSIRVAISGTGPPRAHTKASIFRMSASGWERAGWALAYVAHYDSAVVPTRTLDRDETIGLEDVSIAWIEVTRFHGTPLSPVDARTLIDGEGALTTRRLLAANALKVGDLRAPFAVATGSSVAIAYERGGLHLELTGKARQSGRIGDVVRIYCPDTNATYRARVVEPGRTQWIETL